MGWPGVHWWAHDESRALCILAGQPVALDESRAHHCSSIQDSTHHLSPSVPQCLSPYLFLTTLAGTVVVAREELPTSPLRLKPQQ